MYASVDIALKFDSIEVATTMSRELRRRLMVVKETESIAVVNVQFDKLIVPVGAYSQQIFYTHPYFYFFLSFLHQTMLLTGQFVQHKRAFIHIYTIVLMCSFFYVNKKFFLCCFSPSFSLSLSLPPFLSSFLCTCA